MRDLVRPLPENDETANLRLGACIQILVLGGFRLGLSEVAVDEIYEEANELAERSGNKVILITLRSAYGVRISGLGRTRENYELSLENLKIGDETGIPVARAGVRVAAAYASFQLGRIGECMRWLEEGNEITGTDLQMGRQEFGLSYRVFFAQMKASMLGTMGRLEESEQQLASALRIARESGVLENLGWALGNVGIHAINTGETVFGRRS